MQLSYLFTAAILIKGCPIITDCIFVLFQTALTSLKNLAKLRRMYQHVRLIYLFILFLSASIVVRLNVAQESRVITTHQLYYFHATVCAQHTQTGKVMNESSRKRLGKPLLQRAHSAPP